MVVVTPAVGHAVLRHQATAEEELHNRVTPGLPLAGLRLRHRVAMVVEEHRSGLMVAQLHLVVGTRHTSSRVMTLHLRLADQKEAEIVAAVHMEPATVAIVVVDVQSTSGHSGVALASSLRQEHSLQLAAPDPLWVS